MQNVYMMQEIQKFLQNQKSVKILNADHKAVSIEISERLLDHFAGEGDSFLMQILPCD